MLFVVLSTIVLASAILCCTFFKVAETRWDGLGVFGVILTIGFGAVCFVGCVFLLITSGGWFAAEQKAKIINREYGTAYTTAEVFYASDVIDKIREVQRNRSEIKVKVE